MHVYTCSLLAYEWVVDAKRGHSPCIGSCVCGEFNESAWRHTHTHSHTHRDIQIRTFCFEIYVGMKTIAQSQRKRIKQWARYNSHAVSHCQKCRATATRKFWSNCEFVTSRGTPRMEPAVVCLCYRPMANGQRNIQMKTITESAKKFVEWMSDGAPCTRDRPNNNNKNEKVEQGEWLQGRPIFIDFWKQRSAFSCYCRWFCGIGARTLPSNSLALAPTEPPNDTA